MKKERKMRAMQPSIFIIMGNPSILEGLCKTQKRKSSPAIGLKNPKRKDSILYISY
jgi:hypothetical protein